MPNAASNSSDSIPAPTVAVSPDIQSRLPTQISKEAKYSRGKPRQPKLSGEYHHCSVNYTIYDIISDRKRTCKRR